MKDFLTQKYFDILIATAVLLVLGIPVGIANIYLGYIIGESPCTLCWNERIGMVVVGMLGIFILRYGLRAKYLVMVFLSAAYGLFMTLRHSSFDGTQADVGMGFGGAIFGAHTYTWGIFVYWAVIIAMSLLLFFMRNENIAKELYAKELKIKEFSPYSKFVVGLSLFVILSNGLQAFISTGIPPYSGKGEPERFSFEYVTQRWTSHVWDRLAKPISFTGSSVVDSPFVAGESAPKKFAFNSDENAGVAVSLKPAPAVLESKELPFQAVGLFEHGNAADIAYNSEKNQFAITSTQAGIYFTDDKFNLRENAILDKPNGYDIPLTVASTFVGNQVVSTAYNKTLWIVEQTPQSKIDEFKEWNVFRKTSGGLMAPLYRERPWVNTVRAKKAYILTLAYDKDSKYMYMLSVPNPASQKIILIKVDPKDNTLSGELVVKAGENFAIKDKRKISEYYITAGDIKDGKFVAYSKNFNTLLVIDLQSAMVEDAYAMPKINGEISGLTFKGDKIVILSHKDSKDYVSEIQNPF
ncbi:disulfide bond formation protein B [Campylobacter geochelonis]|uniref:Disulfide bond formation protein, DsbB family n=1 Tax=Campylobacter geochelonis TaxID=1780362 RepID=A0A128EFN6_9BACT|nr:disulfide bond formation protein B [Campylobacter geochelonis]QKF72000.1 disulfide bond formation protein, DsbB family [Campylobacter geochelonis]CZE47714.1 disulfide bond formation protein%2C DsbB family [Campylobacter geochelonis]